MALTKLVNGARVVMPDAEETAIRAAWAAAPPARKPDPTPLQIIEEMEAREAAGQVPTLTAFRGLAGEVEMMKLLAAQGTISRLDRRIAGFGQAFGMSAEEIDQFMDAAAARATTET